MDLEVASSYPVTSTILSIIVVPPPRIMDIPDNLGPNEILMAQFLQNEEIKHFLSNGKNSSTANSANAPHELTNFQVPFQK